MTITTNHQSLIKTEACYETSSSLHIRDKICSTEKQEWRKWHHHELLINHRLLNGNVLESYFCLFSKYGNLFPIGCDAEIVRIKISSLEPDVTPQKSVMKH